MNNQDHRPSFAQGALVALLTLTACVLAAALFAWSL